MRRTLGPSEDFPDSRVQVQPRPIPSFNYVPIKQDPLHCTQTLRNKDCTVYTCTHTDVTKPTFFLDRSKLTVTKWTLACNHWKLKFSTWKPKPKCTEQLTKQQPIDRWTHVRQDSRTGSSPQLFGTITGPELIWGMNWSTSELSREPSGILHTNQTCLVI